MRPRRRAGPAAPVLAPLPLWPALAWVLFVVYGSLVPLDFRPLPWDEAARAYAHMPWLELGVGSRADWVANILLYLPLGFFTAAWLAGTARRRSVRLTAALVASALGIALACAVEFAQLYFPPRTVSWNDLLAETLGSLLGAGLFLGWGHHLLHLWARLRGGGAAALRALFLVYLGAYLLLNLFPFDVLVNGGELAAKWSGDSVGWLLADSTCQSAGFCLFKLLMEAAAVAPLGAFLAHARGARGFSPLQALFLGLTLGLVVEGAQLFIASGIAQGVSVGTRALGVLLGSLALGRWRAPGNGVLALAALLLVALLMWLNRWFAQPWLPLDQGLGRLAQVHFQPFYYHYYTSEPVALVSLLFAAGSYAVVGALCWLWRPGRAVALGALAALALALVLETGKLFVATVHPDPSNLFIAPLAAALAAGLLERGRRWRA